MSQQTVSTHPNFSDQQSRSGCAARCASRRTSAIRRPGPRMRSQASAASESRATSSETCAASTLVRTNSTQSHPGGQHFSNRRMGPRPSNLPNPTPEERTILVVSTERWRQFGAVPQWRVADRGFGTDTGLDSEGFSRTTTFLNSTALGGYSTAAQVNFHLLIHPQK